MLHSGEATTATWTICSSFGGAFWSITGNTATTTRSFPADLWDHSDADRMRARRARRTTSSNYYHPSTHPFYHGRPVHSLQSVTKSVAATVIGVALRRGDIDSLDAPLLRFFDNYDTQDVDTRLRAATLEDPLTMRTGIAWHEQDRPLDATSTTIQLERSEDWIQFTLDQPSDTAPKEKLGPTTAGAATSCPASSRRRLES